MSATVRDANAEATAAYTKWRLLCTQLLATASQIEQLGSKVTPELTSNFIKLAREEQAALDAMVAARATLKGGRTRRHRRKHRKTHRRR